jgi:hypothetical protein
MKRRPAGGADVGDLDDVAAMSACSTLVWMVEEFPAKLFPCHARDFLVVLRRCFAWLLALISQRAVLIIQFAVLIVPA